MNFILVGMQQNVGKNRQSRAGTDYVLDLLQTFEQFFFGNTKFHDEQKRLRCSASDFIRQAAISHRDIGILPMRMRWKRILSSPLKRAVDEGYRLANVILFGHSFL